MVHSISQCPPASMEEALHNSQRVHGRKKKTVERTLWEHTVADCWVRAFSHPCALIFHFWVTCDCLSQLRVRATRKQFSARRLLSKSARGASTTATISTTSFSTALASAAGPFPVCTNILKGDKKAKNKTLVTLNWSRKSNISFTGSWIMSSKSCALITTIYYE